MVMNIVGHKEYEDSGTVENVEVECLYGDVKRAYRVPLMGKLTWWHLKKMLNLKSYGRAWVDIKRFHPILDAVYRKVDGQWKVQEKEPQITQIKSVKSAESA